MATDRRTKYTKSVIRQALFDLMEDNPVNKITVTDICKEADINRSTFYAYYEDVNELLSAIQNELFENVVLSLSTENWFDELLRLVDENRDLCKVLIGPHGDSSFLRQLIYLGYENGVATWRENYPDATPEQLDYYYAYMASGVIGVLENWVFSDYAMSIEEIGEMLMGYSMDGLHYLRTPKTAAD